jgi:hypothetical protein
MRLQTSLLAVSFALLSTPAWAVSGGEGLSIWKQVGDGSSIRWEVPGKNSGSFGPSFLSGTLADALSTATRKAPVNPTLGARKANSFVRLHEARAGGFAGVAAVPEPSAFLLFGAGVLITRASLRRPRSWSS